MKSAKIVAILCLVFVSLLCSVFNASASNITDGLVAYYHGDGNGNDAIGSYNAARTGAGATATQPGIFGNGLSSNGIINNYWRSSTGANLSGRFCNLTAMTVSVWYKRLGGNNWSGGILSLGGNSNSMIVSDDNTGIDFYLYNFSGDSFGGEIYNTNLTEGQWYHFVGILDAGTMYGYLNGVKLATNFTFDGGIRCVNNPSYLGAYNFDRPMNGTIDEIMLWNRSLNETEIAALYNNGSGIIPAHGLFCLDDSDCNALDLDYCLNTSVMHNEGTCVSYNCTNATTLTEECDNGIYCDGQEYCSNASCFNETKVDCSGNNISEIATCTNNPDRNRYTWDYRAAFKSECDESSDSCPVGSTTIIHDANDLRCCIDADNDSVCDIVDSCLNSRAGELIDANGCDPFQFCASVSLGECYFADFLGNEPSATRERKFDCTIAILHRGGYPYLHPTCVPTTCCN